MQKTKKQHYVPQSYLTRFSTDDSLFVFDKLTQESFKANIRDVAQERYFNDLPASVVGANGDVQAVEKAFAAMEGHFSNITSQLLEHTGKRRITNKLKKELSLLIAVQAMRTKEERNTFIEMMEKGAQALVDKFPNSEELRLKFDQTAASTWHAFFMFNTGLIPDLAQALSGHIWRLGVSKSRQPLYTSDHPVAKRAHIKHPVLSTAGYGSLGIEVAFPLSSTHILILREKTVFRDLKKTEGRILYLNDENVKYYNSMQVFNSNRWIYSSDSNFYVARQLCETHSDLCSPHRVRVEVN